jgi:hypothetical protein
LCVVWLASASATGAPGSGGATLVLVGAPYPAFERELSAEAREVGLTVVRDAAADPARAMEVHDAVAVLDVQSPARVDVWIADPGNHRTILAHDVLTAEASSREPFAERVIEQVRAHLVKLSLWHEEDPGATPASQAVPPAAEPPSAAVPASKPIAKEPPPPNDTGDNRRGDRPAAGGDRRLLWLEGGVGPIAASGGVPATLQAKIGLRFVQRRFQAEGFGLLPLSDGDVAGKEGSAAVSLTMIGAAASYAFSDEERPFQAIAGAGAAALLLTMDGTATSPYSAHEESLATGAFFLQVGARYRIAEWFGVRLSTLGGLAVPRPVMTFAGREVAAWGPAFGGIVASCEFGSPVPRERP